MTVTKKNFPIHNRTFFHYFVISTVKNVIFSSVTVLLGYQVRLKTDFSIFLPYHTMKSTVQNRIFRNWIRKKWIFVRLKIHFFVFQPYMGERPAEGFHARPAEGFRAGPCRRIPRKTL